MTDPISIRSNEMRLCMDCGKQFPLGEAVRAESVSCCPRCFSVNHMEYVEAQHENIVVDLPECYTSDLEPVARVLFDRVTRLTKWREAKVRLWFTLPNPLLGNVSPEWMILNDRAMRLSKFIDDAEYFAAETAPC